MERSTPISTVKPMFFRANKEDTFSPANSLPKSFSRKTPRSINRKPSPGLSNIQNKLVDMRQSLRQVNNMSKIYSTVHQLNPSMSSSIDEVVEGQLSPTLFDDAQVYIIRSTKWITKERKIAAEHLTKAVGLRKKYQKINFENIGDEAFKNRIDEKYHIVSHNLNDIFQCETSILVFPDHYTDSTPNEIFPGFDDYVTFEMEKGTFIIKKKEDGSVIYKPYSLSSFLEDYQGLLKIIDSGPCKTFASERMSEIHHRYELHKTFSYEKSNTTKDFFSQNKVDTHIHAEQCFTEKEFLNYMQKQMEGNEIVNEYIDNEGNKKEETLKDVIERLGMGNGKMSLHKMELRAHHHFFPEGNLIKHLFLSIDNKIDGRYYAELVQNVLRKMEDTNCYFELRLSIDARKKNNWDELSEWVDKYHLQSKHNKWIIQFPKRFKEIQNGDESFCFTNYLENIFKPLFEVSQNPNANPKLSKFLENVSGFDLVGKENEVEPIIGNDTFDPSIWNKPMNPSYYIYMYYLYANICTLNLYRLSRGLSTFDFRPHCGQGGHYSHLAAAFLTVKGISQGIKLVDSPTLKYLYLVEQIGISMSPMANHLKGFSYESNPFNNFFKRGLNVTLSSDEPLQVHRTQEPLMEEFAMAQQTWRYEDVDLIEMCVNSINQSGFSLTKKRELIGNYRDIIITGRSKFRRSIIDTERDIIDALITDNQKRVFQDIPYSTVNMNYKTKDGHERDIMREITYWLSMRSKYMSIFNPTSESDNVNNNDTINNDNNDQEENENINQYSNGFKENEFEHVYKNNGNITEPTIPQLFCSMSEGVFNVYNTPDAICDIDHFHQSFCYCFDCRKNYCKKCFKHHHKEHYHSIRRITHNSYFPLINYDEYIRDYTKLSQFTSDGPSRTFCYKQLLAKQEMFKLHKVLNNSLETEQIKQLPIDFEKSIKVDTVLSAPRSSHPRDLLKFIEEKKEVDGDRIVFPELTIKTENGTRVYKQVTLKNAFTIYGIDELSLDNMSVTFDPLLIQRYDLWETRNTIFNVKELRDLFLTPKNYVNGQYYCEFLKKTQFENKNAIRTRKHVELHLCCYGETYDEVENLAKVIVQNQLIHPETNYFALQITRKYAELKKNGYVQSFEEVLRNIFEPLFEATLNPEKHPEMDTFLSNVGSFDCKGDETLYEGKISLGSLPSPAKWDGYKEPPFAYWLYYVYANVNMLNNLRKMFNMNTFDFKPHCGEAGDPNNNSAAFLLANSISHGITLNGQNTLQYLYVLAEIGISCSPIYDKFLYDVIEHPFYKFFMRGLKVTLATDSPLHTHSTREPLVEEYASAIKYFKLTFSDIAEITRNSLDISSFPEDFKVQHLYDKNGKDMVVPEIRIDFRKKIRDLEFDTLMKFNLGRSNYTEKDEEVMKKMSLK